MIGALLGACLAGSLLLVVSVVRHPGLSFTQRVLPYTDEGWKPPRRKWSERLSEQALAFLEKMGSTTASVERRLDALGEGTVRDFRFHQARLAIIGAGVGMALAFLMLARQAPGLLALACPCVGGVAGVLAADSILTRRVAAHSAAMTYELPDIAELLALAVGAGESIRGSVEYASSVATGALARELRRAVADMHAGESLTVALTSVARRSGNNEVERFMEALVTSVNRGTPLAGVLRAQAEDAREAARRHMLEAGGRKEIQMLIPVVFLIMPVTVLFTLYPGLMAIVHLP